MSVLKKALNLDHEMAVTKVACLDMEMDCSKEH